MEILLILAVPVILGLIVLVSNANKKRQTQKRKRVLSKGKTSYGEKHPHDRFLDKSQYLNYLNDQYLDEVLSKTIVPLDENRGTKDGKKLILGTNKGLTVIPLIINGNAKVDNEKIVAVEIKNKKEEDFLKAIFGEGFTAKGTIAGGDVTVSNSKITGVERLENESIKGKRKVAKNIKSETTIPLPQQTDDKKAIFGSKTFTAIGSWDSGNVTVDDVSSKGADEKGLEMLKAIYGTDFMVIGTIAGGNVTMNNSTSSGAETIEGESKEKDKRRQSKGKNKMKENKQVKKEDDKFTAIGMITTGGNVNINNSEISGIRTINDESDKNQIDVRMLTQELALLRKAMKKQAHTPEHNVAIAEVAKAEQSIKKGNSKEFLKHLKSAGNWALDIATQIGVSVAVQAIKISLGL